MIVQAYIESTWNYWHLPVRGKKNISEVRIHDVGRPFHPQRVRGFNVRTKKWQTIGWRISRNDVKVVKRGRVKTLRALDENTQRILNSIKSNFGKIRVIT